MCGGDSALLRAAILDELPQWQCAQCGYGACEPYADAILAGEAINCCPPGGQRTVDALATLLGKPSMPLDPALGAEPAPAVASIREDECIGCAKCVQACPVDAILGAMKLMHTVIAAECTGCALCVAPCPVDCIDMLPLPDAGERTPSDERERARHARRRYEHRRRREAIHGQERPGRRVARDPAPRIRPLEERVRVVEEAVARVRARKLGGTGAYRPLVEAAIEQARRRSLQRVLATANRSVTRVAPPPTAEEVRRRIDAREKKLARAQRKLAAAIAANDAASSEVLQRSIATHRMQLAELREQLCAMAGS